MELENKVLKAVADPKKAVRLKVKNMAVQINIGQGVENNDNFIENIKSFENNYNHNRDSMVSTFAVGNIL
jgi:hypothetical protein